MAALCKNNNMFFKIGIHHHKMCVCWLLLGLLCSRAARVARASRECTNKFVTEVRTCLCLTWLYKKI